MPDSIAHSDALMEFLDKSTHPPACAVQVATGHSGAFDRRERGLWLAAAES
jgi:hypothetical protein